MCQENQYSFSLSVRIIDSPFQGKGYQVVPIQVYAHAFLNDQIPIEERAELGERMLSLVNFFTTVPCIDLEVGRGVYLKFDKEQLERFDQLDSHARLDTTNIRYIDLE